MSALGHKQTFAPQNAMSALHPIVDRRGQRAGQTGRLLPRPKATSCCRLDQWRTGNPQFAGHSRSFLDQLLVCKAIKPANVTDYATIDDETKYFGFACRALHRGRCLTTLQ